MAMTIVTRRKLLIALIAGLAAVGVLAGLWITIGPLNYGPGGKASVKDVLPSSAGMDKLGKPEDYAVIYRRDLRKPIIDRPRTIAAVPLKTTLLCTMIEPDRKRAILQTTGGNIVEVEVGQLIDGDKITSIQDGKVELIHNGVPAVLSIQEQQPTPN